jgi:hypothetical protein
MKTEAAFWDTSAIVPVCCIQDFSAQARKTYRIFKKPILWWGTPVEMRSAFEKLNQTELLTAKQTSNALRLWKSFRANSRLIVLYEKTTTLAEDLPERYGLRSLDAFQLAAALVWCKEKPRNRPFICADVRLGGAARDAGYDVISLS